jgi:hypothetical protein
MISHVKAFALEDNAYRTDNAPYIATTNRALRQRIVRHPLPCLKLMIALITSV